MQIDPGTITAIGLGFTAVGWIGRHFIQDVVRSEPRPEPRPPESKPQVESMGLTVRDLKAALAIHEVQLLERFNGRYPSKEVFEQGLRGLKEEVAEVRNYIGDVEERVTARLASIEEHLRRGE